MHKEKSIYYKYLFWDWLYKNVMDAKTKIELNAFKKFNVANKNWLLTYIIRWTTLSGVAFGAGYTTSSFVLFQALMFTAFACAFIIMIVAIVSWLLLTTIAL